MVRNCADETLCSRLRNPSTQHRHFLKFVTLSGGKVPPGGFGFLVAAPIGQPLGVTDFRGMSYQLLLLLVVLVATAAARCQGVDKDSSFCEGLD